MRENGHVASGRVIFLDIDGVLAPIRERDRYGDIDPAGIRVLDDIVTRSGADIVISSTWRFGKTTEEMQSVLAEHGFTGRVIGATSTATPGLTRGEEIAGWLADHPVASFVIIDDHRDLGELVGHLVQTQPGHGLLPAHADLAVGKLLADRP